jgi:hypothetical protein
LKGELENLKGRDISYLYHEYFEDINSPMYFRDFASALSQHSLQYLADARQNGFNVPANHPVMRRLILESQTDRLRREECMDFLSNSPFRRALVIHENREIDFAGMTSRFENLHMLSRCRPKETPPPGSHPKELRFDHNRLASRALFEA